jgi:dTDP-4-dehydrorhamnose 3,5-epimerase/CDP-3, 6-dideoxy-D-glycero-D-glycero-4-hexulose-5-epimerase
MKVLNTEISGLKIIEPNIFEDNRGKFVKTFNDSFFREIGIDIDIKESYYSISQKDVIRGMHFQIPPYEHTKIVYVPYGRVLDTVLDIRKGSPTYGSVFSIELSSQNGKFLVIPAGLAHGFKSLEDNTNVTYLQTTVYSPEYDFGIKYDSFGFNWKCENKNISQRDLSFPLFKDFNSPFVFEE